MWSVGHQSTYASLFSVFVVTKTLCISAEITLDILSKNRYIEKPVKLHVARAKMQIVLSAILHSDDDFVRKSGIFL